MKNNTNGQHNVTPEMKEIHECRILIQTLVDKLEEKKQLTKEGKLELEVVTIKLTEARMWLGEYLHKIGTSPNYSTSSQEKAKLINK